MGYSHLSEEKKIARCTTPILVSVTNNPDEETPEQAIANHERFRNLPFEAKYKLGFQHTPAIIRKIGEEFNLDPLKMASIARAVRSFYFRDLPREKIAEFLVWEMEISTEQAQKIASLVVQKIIDAPIPKEVSDQTVELPLLDALAKYPRVSEQTVTEDRIMVKSESAPVRGSIRNWLRSYRDAVGIRKHSAMERGQFLFQGENTKRLGASEREKLSLLFRSLDENAPVSIDVGRQEVIFPAFGGGADDPSLLSNQKEPSPPGVVSFPVGPFPAKQAPIQKALEWQAPQSSPKPLPAFFGKAPEPSHPEMTSPRLGALSAPVYEPPSSMPAAISPSEGGGVVGSPFSSVGNMSFSSSHVLPNERGEDPKEVPPKPEPPKSPEAINVIRPRGNRFGFRGTSPGDDFDTPRVLNLRG